MAATVTVRGGIGTAALLDKLLCQRTTVPLLPQLLHIPLCIRGWEKSVGKARLKYAKQNNRRTEYTNPVNPVKPHPSK
jgi:hypothetical protein